MLTLSSPTANAWIAVAELGASFLRCVLPTKRLTLATNTHLFESIEVQMPKKDIKRILSLALMLFVTSSAWADWILMNESDVAKIYIDPTTVRGEGHLRKVWQLLDFKLDVLGVRSFREKMEYDCEGERFRRLWYSEHSAPMAGGRMLKRGGTDDDWNEIPPKTVAEQMMQIVCTN